MKSSPNFISVASKSSHISFYLKGFMFFQIAQKELKSGHSDFYASTVKQIWSDQIGSAP